MLQSDVSRWMPTTTTKAQYSTAIEGRSHIARSRYASTSDLPADKICISTPPPLNLMPHDNGVHKSWQAAVFWVPGCGKNVSFSRRIRSQCDIVRAHPIGGSTSSRDHGRLNLAAPSSASDVRPSIPLVVFFLNDDKVEKISFRNRYKWEAYPTLYSRNAAEPRW